MRSATTFLTILTASVLLTSAALAAGSNPPLVGTYKTLSATILPGRATESFPCDGCEGQIGNMINSASWDGTSLGTNWTLSCPQIAAPPIMTYNGVVGGTGQQIWQTTYSGGTLTLAGSGAWGTGDPSYTGSVSSFTVIATKQYVGGVLVGAVANINFTGTIDGYDNCFSMAISNAELVGATPGAPAESGPFPAFVGPTNCSLTGSHGSYQDVHDITFSIIGTCSVPTRATTWGQVKSIYR